MKFAGPYAGWVTHTVWRKKMTILVLSLFLILMLVSFKYYRDGFFIDEKDNNVYQNEKIIDPQEQQSQLTGSSVQFVTKTTLISPEFGRQKESSPKIEMGRDMGSVKIDSEGNSYIVKSNYIPKERLFHLDLKGAPPRVSYLQQVLQLVKNVGGTSVLFEWEDMFPWHGPLETLSAHNAYTKQEVETLLQTCKTIGLEVIPLIQTFGHVEFALKQEKFAHLREVPNSAQALCPSLNASVDFIQLMIDQIMEYHSDAKYLHIGCDEVFQMGECIRCRTQQRENLYLSHVVRVANYIKSRFPSVTPIIWDDMLRHISTSSMEQYRIGSLVQPMVWVYAEDVYRFVPTSIWDKYATIFPKVWAASAFKGAFGETLYIPNVKRHLENNLRWLEVMRNEEPKFSQGFVGIAVTGWQRYDHFSVLCEILPAAIPSLVVTLVAVTHGFLDSSLKNEINSHLNCGIFGPTTFFNLNTDPFLWESFSRCPFPGHLFFRLTSRLNSASKETDELITSIRKEKGWMTEYNVKHNFSTPLRVDELMQEHPRLYHLFTSLARSVKESLNDVFDDYTISEWLEQNIYPYILSLEQIQRDSISLKMRKIWPRRPFPILLDLQRFGVKAPEAKNDVTNK